MNRLRELRPKTLRFPQFVAAALTILLLPVSVVRADDHVLSLSEIRGEISQQADQRRANAEAITRFFSLPQVEDTLKTAGVDVGRLQASVSLLSDEERADLASRTLAVEDDITGGELTQAQQTLVILAIAGWAFIAILVIAFN